ncbi:MAG: type II toxin-antitoxin system RelE/ParE family toxin [Defluviitaleaceae bacterium]|nr:type II toxin-antitoxin system RelE/ParE family toxin [Defluviitaleaceae bacterium]
MRKIKISDDAYYDIEEMFSYISADNKKAASDLRKRLYTVIKGLKDFPFKYPAVQSEDAPGAQRGYRYMAVNPYIVFYRVLDDSIIVARVLHSRQNWLHLLFGYNGDN